jgi:hypothetical protein
MLFYFTLAIFYPALDALGVVTCLYTLLAITAHSGFSRLLTISSRLHLNNLRSRSNLRHNPLPLGCTNLSKFSFQNSESQSLPSISGVR